MVKRATREQPDAFVYQLETGALARLCRHCTTTRTFEHRDQGAVFREAQLHLWSSHSQRRVWIDFSDPRHRDMVNIALPIVLASNTTRHG